MTSSLVLAVGALALVGCGDSGGGTKVDSAAQIQVEPQKKVIFSSTIVGQSSAEQITISNSGNGELILYSIRLSENDATKEFSLSYEVPRDSEGNRLVDIDDAHVCPNRDRIALVASGNENPAGGEVNWCSLWVVLEAKDSTPDSGTLTVRSNDTVVTEVVLDLTTGESNPELTADPPEVRFNDVEEGDTATQKVTIFNSGKADLVVSGFEVASDAEGQFTARISPDPADSNQFSLPATLRPMTDVTTRDSITLIVSYTPNRVGSADGLIRIGSNDPRSMQREIPLIARSIKPCIEISPADADFGDVAIGDAKDLGLDLTNCGNAPLIITSAAFDAEGTSPDFTIISAPAGLECDEEGRGCTGTVTIEPDDTQTLHLQYTPDLEGPDGGQLQLATNVPKKELVPVRLFARGTTNTCPVSVAEARVVGADSYDEFGDDEHRMETIPLKTLELRGDRSTDPDGSIASYKWTVLERPQDSTAQLSPHEAEANPTFFLDLAGRYVFELQVTDNKGLPSCKNAMVVVIAIPDEDLHIQLVWDTPADPDQTDEGFAAGSDLDLHLMHPIGDWFDLPYDCFYGNPSPDWNRPGNGLDDPSLDRDDTDGAGPENINLDNPENNRVYRVGVHYFNEHGYGASFATVRIYVQGIPRFELPNKRLASTDYFWDVATISWPGGQIQQIDTVSATTPNGGGDN